MKYIKLFMKMLKNIIKKNKDSILKDLENEENKDK